MDTVLNDDILGEGSGEDDEEDEEAFHKGFFRHPTPFKYPDPKGGAPVSPE